MDELNRIKQVIETALLTSTEPLTPVQMGKLFEPALAAEIVRRMVDELSADWTGRGVELKQVASGWRFQSKRELQSYLDRLSPEKPPRYSRSAMETLAIIAYRQPVTRPGIEDVRGVDSGAVVKALLERRLVKILGKKDEIGRPILYGTTREFLEFFALKDLSALPTLREFHELSEEHRTLVDREAPAPAGTEGLVEELANPAFEQGLEQAAPGAEEAMEALEQAIEEAEARSKAAAASLGGESSPQHPPAEESDR